MGFGKPIAALSAGIAVISLLLSFDTHASEETQSWPEPDPRPRFAEEVAARHGFDAAAVRELLAPLVPNPVVLRAIAPPSEPGVRSWQRYRARFINRKRIDDGVRFWQSHSEVLKRAEAEFGVPASIMVAIIGVETEYGRNKGRFLVLDALATLAFAYPPRAAFFRDELEQYLLMTRENRLDPATVRGSFAGAIGIPQFMPGSLRRYATDFDGDGRIDLFGSPEDAIGSVGRFLSLHGWQAGQPVTEPLPGIPEQAAALVGAGIRPVLDEPSLLAADVAPTWRPSRYPVALIDLDTPDQPAEYWWGHANFYVITRYNRSNFYAMSVAQLASEIARAREQASPRRSSSKTVKKGSRGKRRSAG